MIIDFDSNTHKLKISAYSNEINGLYQFLTDKSKNKSHKEEFMRAYEAHMRRQIKKRNRK